MTSDLNSREKRLAMIAAGLILILVLHFLIFGPLFDQFSSLRRELRGLSVKLVKYQRMLSFEKEIRKVYGEYLGRVKGEGNAQEEVSKFLQEVNQLCEHSSVRITNIKPLGAREGGLFKKLSLEIEVDADQVKLGRLLFELKNSQTMIHVDHLRVSAAARGENLKCDFVLSRILA